ncbi:hypothetical protein NDU88_001843 [Pleurodeles waltl]|uniref:Uncharacterized protein n=1 Tax=Pleurodeles waltl TaxID=8319 RepID=A0AAV7L1Q1_PLEWA|nr:hypothetical protein NDU88_001843 [Pleurodeles waltl]
MRPLFQFHHQQLSSPRFRKFDFGYSSSHDCRRLLMPLPLPTNSLSASLERSSEPATGKTALRYNTGTTLHHTSAFRRNHRSAMRTINAEKRFQNVTTN